MDKKVNIGIFGTKGLGNYGGFETIAQKIHENIDGENFNLFISKEREQKARYELEKINDKTTLINQKSSFLKKYSKHLDNIINEGSIITEVYKENYWELDAIFQCGSTPGLWMRGIQKKGPLLLWNPDGIEWKRKKFSLHGRVILYLSTLRGIQKSHAITVDSKAVAKYLKNVIKNKSIYYFPSGSDLIEENDVDYSLLKEYDLKENDYYISVGRAIPENHILEILEYFLKTKTTKKMMIISNFGSDIYSQKALEIINQNKDRIIFKGTIYNQRSLNTLRYYAYAYLHGHSVGGTNPSLLEALGAGNPCICYDVEYNKEVAKDAAVYFSDLETFIKAIDDLEKNTQKTKEMSKIAKNIIKENFTWDYISELHESIAVHCMLENKKISQENFEKWLEKKVYKDKLKENNFGIINVE